MESKLRRALLGFYIGDAYGRGGDTSSPTWTENGDILALILRIFTDKNPQPPSLPERISEWVGHGLVSIGKSRDQMSAVAEKVVANPAWRNDPASVALTLAKSPDHLTNINLPMATSIGFICARNTAISAYASMFVASPLSANMSIFYVSVLREVITRVGGGADGDTTPESIIGAVLPKLPMMLIDDELYEYSRKKLSDLDLATRPFYVMTTAKVVCYALRIVHYANTHGCRPDLRAIIRHLSCDGAADNTTNCAIAASIVCAGCNDVCGYSDLLLEMDHREWITDLVDGAIAVWSGAGASLPK